MAKKQKSADGTRKSGHKVQCEAYRARGQREKNKAVRLRKHLIRHPADRCAFAALSRVAPATALKLAA